MAPKKSLYCSVVNCSNTSSNSPGIHFYRFPSATIYTYKLERRNNWICALKRQAPDGSPWVPHKNSRICSQHFVGNKKVENPSHPAYNPTIFPEVYHTKRVDEKCALERYKRAIKRRRIPMAQETTTSNIEILNLNEQHGIEQHGATKSGQVDQETQVDFIDEDRIDAGTNCRTFTCNRYIYPDSNKTNSDVEIQVYISDSDSRTHSTMKKKYIDIGCGNHVDCENKLVGPEIYDHDSKGWLKCTRGFHGLSSINDNQMIDLAGVTRNTFQLLLKTLPVTKDIQISKEDRLLIFLFKMKRGLTFAALSVLFGIYKSTVSRVFYSTLQYLTAALKDFVFWPSKEIVQATMPQTFQETYSNCRVIIDCTEFRVEQPSSIESRVQFYSHHKKGFTLKVLVGFTPSGAISFISRCYAGRTTDAQITSSSGFLDLLEPDDLVLANKGFPQIKAQLDESGRGISLAIPPLLHNTLSAEEVHETYKVTSIRIHIERIMQALRTYRILDKFTLNMFPHSDNIVFVCCALVNLQLPIMKESDVE